MPRRGEPAGSRLARTPWVLPALVAVLAIAVGSAPIGMAMAVVLLCAGPHNWCEARYFLSRMPRRWGPLRPFFLTALLGLLTLTAAFVGLAVWPRLTSVRPEVQDVALAGWHTGLLAWVAVLLVLRRREGGRDATWVPPTACALIAVAWLAPTWVSVALVYVHPLLALAFLDRELAVRRAPWHPAYRRSLTIVPCAVACLWLLMPAGAEAAGGTSEAVQAGAFLLPDTCAAPLLATHVFLESLHYAVWILGMPLATAAVPWHLRAVPLAGRSTRWRAWLGAGLAAGGLVVVALWILFTIDYETTRQAYFTVAIAHVLAEVPFLVRAT